MREPSASIVRKVQSGFSMFHLSGAKIRKIRSSPFHQADKIGNHIREKLLKERGKRLNQKIYPALKAGDYDKFDRLMKELHTPIELPG